jgi:hypothetical protein
MEVHAAEDIHVTVGVQDYKSSPCFIRRRCFRKTPCLRRTPCYIRSSYLGRNPSYRRSPCSRRSQKDRRWRNVKIHRVVKERQRQRLQGNNLQGEKGGNNSGKDKKRTKEELSFHATVHGLVIVEQGGKILQE